MQSKHLWLLDRNLKYLKYLTKLELFDSQIFQILPILKLEKLKSLNFTIFETWLIFEKKWLLVFLCEKNGLFCTKVTYFNLLKL